MVHSISHRKAMSRAAPRGPPGFLFSRPATWPNVRPLRLQTGPTFQHAAELAVDPLAWSTDRFRAFLEENAWKNRDTSATAVAFLELNQRKGIQKLVLFCHLLQALSPVDEGH